MLFSSISENKMRQFAKSLKKTAKEQYSRTLQSAERARLASAHANAEQLWASFTPTPSASPVIWPIQAEKKSSTRPNQNSTSPLSTLGRRIVEARSQQSSPQTSNAEEFPAEDIPEFVWLYNTRFCGLQRPKVSQTAYKEKLEKIHCAALRAGSEKYCTEYNIHGTSHLRHASAVPNDTINSSTLGFPINAKADLQGVIRAGQSARESRAVIKALKAKSGDTRTKTAQEPHLGSTRTVIVDSGIARGECPTVRFRAEPNTSATSMSSSL
ncbi:hypothetical protein FRC03_002073, partial [Tulasnella sp. 419]